MLSLFHFTQNLHLGELTTVNINFWFHTNGNSGLRGQGALLVRPIHHHNRLQYASSQLTVRALAAAKASYFHFILFMSHLNEMCLTMS